MRTLLFLIFCLSGSGLAQDPEPPASVPLPAGATQWKLIFNDDFPGAAYDTSNWNPYADWGGNGSFNNGRERYYASQIRLSDGVCHLVAEPNPGATEFTGSYRSGELISARANTNASTPYKFSFLYGYVETRIKIVNVSGFFGAFWMLPCKKNYTYEWEIDILEVLGTEDQTMFQTYHYCEGLPLDQSRDASWTPNQGLNNNGDAPVLDYSTGYHTFGLDWQPDHLTFYIDGIASGTFPTPGANNSNIANTPGYILIQQMVENNWCRSWDLLVPDTSTSRDTFHIDYVRVWQGDSGPGVEAAPALAAGPGARVEMTVYNIKGQTVRRQRDAAPGDGALLRGLPNGLYLIRITAGRDIHFKKRVVIR
jgi:beta-glucanase (GH16 family)